MFTNREKKKMYKIIKYILFCMLLIGGIGCCPPPEPSTPAKEESPFNSPDAQLPEDFTYSPPILQPDGSWLMAEVPHGSEGAEFYITPDNHLFTWVEALPIFVVSVQEDGTPMLLPVTPGPFYELDYIKKYLQKYTYPPLDTKRIKLFCNPKRTQYIELYPHSPENPQMFPQIHILWTDPLTQQQKVITPDPPIEKWNTPPNHYIYCDGSMLYYDQSWRIPAPTPRGFEGRKGIMAYNMRTDESQIFADPGNSAAETEAPMGIPNSDYILYISTQRSRNDLFPFFTRIYIKKKLPADEPPASAAPAQEKQEGDANGRKD